MFAFIRGKLIQCNAISAIVESTGIGYRIFIPASFLIKMPPLGHEITLHTSFVVRELSQALYGFHTTEERDLFESLLGVTGIGPKTALSIIGHMSISDMQQAVMREDIGMLAKVPGIGKKTAERLIMEMRDKVGHFSPPETSEWSMPAITSSLSHKFNDALGALINLGYNQATAQKAIKKTMQESGDTVELAQLIMLSLKNV